MTKTNDDLTETTHGSEPTKRGKELYPPNGYYVDLDERVPCTCKPECKSGCKGECGCKAHNYAYNDFLSGAGDW